MSTTVPIHLPSPVDRARLGQLISAFHSFEQCYVLDPLNNQTANERCLVATLKADIRQALFDPLSTKISGDLGCDLGVEQSSPALYAALRALLGYFVDLSINSRADIPLGTEFIEGLGDQYDRHNQEQKGTHERLRRVELLADVLANLLSEQFGKTCFGINIDFNRISSIRRAYWSARRRRTQQRRERHPTHRVIRINDIPFAEAVFPELMSINAHELGYTIEVIPDIAWSEVGAALFTNRIDAAIYNGSIRRPIQDFRHFFDHKIIYESGTLFSYGKYVILENPQPQESIRNSFGVPWKSDFEDVVNQHLNSVNNRTNRSMPEGHLTGIEYCSDYPKNERRDRLDVTIHFCDTADQALQRLVDGRLHYCVVGGLQSHYGITQFGASGRGRHRVRRLGYLDRTGDSSHDDAVRFWVAVDRDDQAQYLINALVTIWNNHVVRGWDRLVHSTRPDIEVFSDRFVELVNSHPHHSYVKNFDALKDLIDFHDMPDMKLKPVTSGAKLVKFDRSS